MTKLNCIECHGTGQVKVRMRYGANRAEHRNSIKHGAPEYRMLPCRLCNGGKWVPLEKK